MLRLYPGISTKTHNEIASYLNECVVWYREMHTMYNNKLKDEMIDKLITSLSYNFGAKLSLYSVYDTLQKFVLYRFCESPPTDGTLGRLPVKPWSEQKLTAHDMVEIIHVIRKQANQGQDIDLSVGLEDREVRSALTHSGKISKFTSAIRCFNVVRDMMIFLDQETASQLPTFEYPEQLGFDMQNFLELTDNLESEDNTTLLVVDSVHDLPIEHRKVIANLSWDIVMDFDGASSFGGLRSGVTHPTVSDRRISVANAQSMHFTKGFTTWLSLSDFVNYAYTPDRDKPKVSGLPFSRGNRTRDIRDLLRNLITSNLVLNRTSGLTIVYMRPWDSVAHELLSLALDEYGDSLRFAYIHNFEEELVRNNLRSIFMNRGIDQEACCRAYNTPLPRFYSAMYEYRDSLALKTQQTETLSAPSADGMKDISKNLFDNVSEYFEVLHSAIGQVTAEESEREVREFYHGAIVPWSAFFYQQVVNVYDERDFRDNVQKIRTVLGAIPEVLRNKIFYLHHSRGIGGTTLLRQFAWEFHMEYPVLVLKKYERGKVKEQIRQLYDMHARKGILIVADEGQFTNNELEDLERDVISNQRACALLIAVHKIIPGRVGSRNNVFYMKALSNGETNVMRLRNQVKKYSTLSGEELRWKDSNFDEFLKQDASMRYPFFIGLYYLEKQFNGVHDYVANILRQVDDDMELKAMTVIALADYYGRIGFPSQVIQHYLGIKQNYLKTHPYANGAFIRKNDNGNAVYSSKHSLISEHILDQISTKLYRGAHKEHLEQLSLMLIKVMKSASEQLPYNNYYGELLERVFIKYKYADGYAPEQQAESDFSKLIETVKLAETRESILRSLAESFAEVVEQLDPVKHTSAFFTAAHFFGHLSRVYTKSIGLRNDQKAVENCQIALDYLNKAKEEDSYIYHMYGMALMRAFQTKYESLDKASVSDGVFDNLEEELAVSASMFDSSAQAGSVAYGVLSKLELYMEYLDFVYAVKRISDVVQLNLLSPRQMKLRSEVEELFAQLEGVQLDDAARGKFLRYETNYRAKIMFNNFGKAIEYYQNRLDQLKDKSGSEIEIIVTTHGLITALLGKYRKMTVDGFSYFEDILPKDVNRILDLIESSIENAFDKTKYHERQRRIGLYHRWLQIAKFSERSVNIGIKIADQWARLDPNDPRPFYYLYTLHYLRAMEGYQDSLDDAEAYRRKCYQRISSRHQSEEELDIRRVRDIIVHGKGMSRMRDVRHEKKLPDSINGMKPMEFYGTFTYVEAKKGFVRLTEPKGLDGAEVKFTLGQGNTLSDKQISHKLVFYAGFTLERINAIDHFVKDLTTGEKLK